VWFALRNQAGDEAVYLGSLIYLVLLIVESRRSNTHLLEMMRLRFENAALADERAAALEAAQASDTAKSRFLAMVSHEIRTPLNGILPVIDMLLAAREFRQAAIACEDVGVTVPKHLVPPPGSLANGYMELAERATDAGAKRHWRELAEAEMGAAR
jgi:signal transduction histidine kinase